MSLHFKALKRLFLGLTLSGGFALVFALVMALILADEIYQDQDTFDGSVLPSVDALVCLAGGRGRIAAAGDLWYRYWEKSKIETRTEPQTALLSVPHLYLSGMGSRTQWSILSQKMRSGVFRVLEPKGVTLETQSSNTEENAEILVKTAHEKGWRKVLLMTSRYHMKRARLIFEKTIQKAGIPLELETFSIDQDPFESSEWRYSLQGIRVTLDEYGKWLYYSTLWKP